MKPTIAIYIRKVEQTYFGSRLIRKQQLVETWLKVKCGQLEHVVTSQLWLYPLKEALCIQTTPEGSRLNWDKGYEEQDLHHEETGGTG